MVFIMSFGFANVLPIHGQLLNNADPLEDIRYLFFDLHDWENHHFEFYH